jgi:hypothetical protein
MVPLVLGFSRPVDMTIHWKALEKHFLMVPVLGLSKYIDHSLESS